MDEVSNEVFWTDKIKKHWIPFMICVIAGIMVFVGFFLVLVVYIDTTDVGGYGTDPIGLFSIGTALQFMIQLMLWDLLIVVLPAGAFFCIFGYLWWNKLSEEEKAELKSREEKQKSKKVKQYGGGGGGASFVVGIIFLIIVGLVDGNWLATFDSLPYTYFVYAYLVATLWFLLIIVIPACILAVIWLIKKK